LCGHFSAIVKKRTYFVEAVRFTNIHGVMLVCIYRDQSAITT